MSSSDYNSDSSYDPQNADMDYYSDDSDLEFDAEGVSDEIEPAGEEDPLGFKFVTTFNVKNPDKHLVDMPGN